MTQDDWQRKRDEAAIIAWGKTECSQSWRYNFEMGFNAGAAWGKDACRAEMLKLNKIRIVHEVSLERDQLLKEREELRAERNAAIKKNAPMFASAEAYFEVNAVEAERDNLKEELAALKAENEKLRVEIDKVHGHWLPGNKEKEELFAKLVETARNLNIEHGRNDQLLADNEKLTIRLEEEKNLVSKNVKWRMNLNAEKENLLADLKVAVVALKFYADQKRYDAAEIVEGLEVLEICEDQGDKATKALSTLTAKYGLGDGV